MLVKLSHHHSSEPFFAPGLLFPVNGMNSSDKMSILSFFCITLQSGIDVGQLINVGPGKFGKKNKCRALDTHFLCSK